MDIIKNLDKNQFNSTKSKQNKQVNGEQNVSFILIFPLEP